MKLKYEIDMHTHTINSDGRHTPFEVIDKASEKGIKVLTFTDHSGVTYSKDIIKYATSKGIDIPFMGIEVSTIHEGHKYHILGYAKNLKLPNVESYLSYPVKVKNDNFKKIVDSLHDMGVNIPSFEEMLKGINEKNEYDHPDKWMYTRTLIAKYVSKELKIDLDRAKSIFSRHKYFETDQKIFHKITLPKEKRYLPTLDVIDFLKENGAGVVLAHPWWECNRTNTPKQVEEHIGQFITRGLDGIESQSYHFTDELKLISEETISKFPNLLKVGGSDFHGDQRSSFGERGTDWDSFEKFTKRIQS